MLGPHMPYVEIRTPAGHTVCGCGMREWRHLADAVEFCRECSERKGHAAIVLEEVCDE